MSRTSHTRAVKVAGHHYKAWSRRPQFHRLYEERETSKVERAEAKLEALDHSCVCGWITGMSICPMCNGKTGES